MSGNPRNELCRARPADPEEYPRLHNLVEGLCIASGLPKPDLYVIDDEACFALVLGRDKYLGL